MKDNNVTVNVMVTMVRLTADSPVTSVNMSTFLIASLQLIA